MKESLINHKTRRAAEARLSGDQPPARRVQGSGEPNRHGMPKLPPGQRAVEKWPVLDLGVRPAVTKANWILNVGGETANSFDLNWDGLLALPQAEDVSDFHCVTHWSRMDNLWRGVPLRTVAELAQPHTDVAHVFFTAYDGYTTNLRLEEALDEDVLLVHGWDGEPLPYEHGGPVRVVVPRKYAWKGAKWIKEILFLSEERKGFWEVRGYSNSAEPWYNDRYAFE